MSEVENLSDNDLFDSAVSDEAADTPSVAEEHVEQPGQPRDEAGRFAKAETEQVQEEAAAERPTVDDNAPHVPSWRVREINEEKRALAAERDALLAEKAKWSAPQPQQPQPEQRPTPKIARPDPLLDPEGYATHVREEIRQELLNERRETSLQAARDAHPEEFDEAYKAAQQRIDPALKARMQASRDPGKTLLEWHRENKVKQEVGNDPNAWLEKKLEERLKDPTFLAKAVELARNSAQPELNNGRPRVELPPTLNGASRSNAMLRSNANNGDVSDRQLFEEIAG